MNNSTKTITLDIETAPRVGLFFGSTYQPNIAKVIAESYVFGFSWKPLGKRVQSCYIWDFPLYKKDPTNDIEVIKKWIEVASDSDIIIGHNSRSFDDKVMFGRAIFHNLPAPEPFATVDTKSDLKRVARNDSNKLDDLGYNYGYGRKHDTGGIELWWACMNGNKKAQKKMVKYCERDVKLTEKLYLRIRPYIKHPPLNVLEGRPDACPKCLSKKVNAGTKYRATNSNLYQYFRCMDCGTSLKRRIAEVNVKPEYVNG